MNLAQLRHSTRDPRVQQLLSQAQIARSQHKQQDAIRLESEAESLFAETEAVYVSLPQEHIKDLKPKLTASALMKSKNLAAKAKIQTLPPKPLKLKPDEVLDAERFDEGVKVRSRTPDRVRLVAMLASLPHFNPLISRNKGASSNAGANEVTQFGLAGAGAGLMAIEPAAGGMLLIFSCALQALTSEIEEEPEETKDTQENEQVEESHEASLFTAGTSSMSWLIADS